MSSSPNLQLEVGEQRNSNLKNSGHSTHADARLQRMRSSISKRSSTQTSSPEAIEGGVSGFKLHLDSEPIDGDQATLELGPHGSLRSPVVYSTSSSSSTQRPAPRLRAVRSANDLKRSLQVDETSLSLARSQSQRSYERFKSDAMFGNVQPGSYCSPVDRISRSRTPSAVALTMAHAEKVSKAIMFGAPLVVTTKEKMKRAARKPVMAPVAMDSSLESPSKRNKVRGGGLGLKQSSSESVLKGGDFGFKGGLPESKSATALRMAARNARTASTANIIEASSATVVRPPVMDAFADWDPMILEAEPATTSPTAEKGEGKADPTDEIGSYKANMARYWEHVGVSMEEGAPSASGAGQKRQLPALSAEQIDGFLLRLAVNEPPPEYHNPQRDNELLQNELDEIKEDHKKSLARSVLGYELLDQSTSRSLGIDLELLHGDVGWWCSQEYLIPEWRVLRITGVPNANVHRSFLQISRRSCSTESVMLDLQKLWLEPTALLGDEEGVNGDMNRSDEVVTFSQQYFTDVQTNEFRQRLPLPLDAFVSHVERTANAVRDTMREYWISAAAAKLRLFLANMQDEDAFAAVAAVDPDKNRAPPLGSAGAMDGAALDGTGGVGEEDMRGFDQWFEQTNGPGADGGAGGISGSSKQLLNEGSAGSNNEQGSPSRNGTGDFMTEMTVLNTASMLMSKQLRSCCEDSLRFFDNFFRRFRSEFASGDSAFKLLLKVNEEYVSGARVPLVTIVPSLETLQTECCKCVDLIVRGAAKFPRAESAFTGGGGAEAMFDPSGAIGAGGGGGEGAGGGGGSSAAGEKLYLGPATAALTSEMVLDVKETIRKELEHHYNGPLSMLKKFEPYAPLAGGETESHVHAALRGGPATGENGEIDVHTEVEQFMNLCENLTAQEEGIRRAVPDLCYYPMFMVECYEAKQKLAKVAGDLKKEIIEHCCGANHDHMTEICKSYQMMADRLTDDPTDPDELKALIEFSNHSAETERRLADEYDQRVYERMRFLLDLEHRFSKDEMQLFVTTHQWPANLKNFQAKSREIQGNRKRHLQMVIEGQQGNLHRALEQLEKKVERIAQEHDTSLYGSQGIHKKLENCLEELEQHVAEAEDVFEQETLLNMPISDNEATISNIRKNMTPLHKLWTAIKTWNENHNDYREKPLPEVSAEDAERLAGDMLQTITKMGKAMEKAGETRKVAKKLAQEAAGEIKVFVNDAVPLMHLICTKGIKERHWEEVRTITGLNFEVDTSTGLAQMLAINLQHHVDSIEDTCVAAAKENGLETRLNAMEAAWVDLQFETKEHRGSYKLTGIDDIQNELDDQIVQTQAMRGNRYIKPFEERAANWERDLMKLQDIIDNWLKVQATWMYLEPIFSSDDIMRQMPVEAKLFGLVDITWRESMEATREDPNVMHVARRENLLESLVEANAKLETIQKGLNAYLFTKMVAFPRFFFLSNDELLEILAETKNPEKVQPYLKKCFDGVGKIEFSKENGDILNCYDPGKDPELLPFYYEDCQHKMINPKNYHGNVEEWLVEVEAIMKKSMARNIDLCIEAFNGGKSRNEWMQEWPGQSVIATNQMTWTLDVENAIRESESDPGAGCAKLAKELEAGVLRTVEVIRDPKVRKRLRTSIGALIVMDVHNKEMVKELAVLKTERVTDFDWQAQLRYYWKDLGHECSAITGYPGTLECRMINAFVLYAYEYIGNTSRLVITPLTDQCYRTLISAIHLNYGGAPEGPAGTGKTETTKDLGRAIAIQCVVTNCSDGLTYQAMEKFFRGLAAAGAWACFDEFNRIQLEVLSVIAQQVLTIQTAKAADQKRFMFYGTELPLLKTCCPFITMNPGYAGRAELPDNLKALFRTVAMMVPDYTMIAEILLYSFGYERAPELSIKITMTYQLCSEQLSSQTHYDYGMRAVISVLRAAGKLKEVEPNTPEDKLVLRSIIDVNLPKFLSPDVPLFGGITNDLFPGVVLEVPDRSAMKKAFEDSCTAATLQPLPYVWDKLTQIYDMMTVRHGFMIVGDPYGGKTCAWKMLAESLAKLHERYPEDEKWTKVKVYLMNPKSISMGELYGNFDPVSHEWSDGILAIQYRNAATAKGVDPSTRKWVLFDGPVDAIWIENMNTVLDDNKKLCLMSGEIIAMSDVMSMMFEPMDLLVASPATVSRCGMVYLEPAQLGWQCILTSWLTTFSRGATDEYTPPFILEETDCQLITELFAWVVEPCLAFLGRELKAMAPQGDAALVNATINILECLLGECLGSGIGAGEDAEKKDVTMRRQHIECAFVFSVVWGICKTGDEVSQNKMSEYLRNIIKDLNHIDEEHPAVNNTLMVRKWAKPDFTAEGRVFTGKMNLPLPEKMLVHDYCYKAKDSKWHTWVDILPPFEIKDGTPYASIVVPHAVTSQMSYMLEMLLSHSKPVMICGPTGTGKSATAAKVCAQDLDQSKWGTISLGFSAKTTAHMTQSIIDGKLMKRRKGIFGPPVGKRFVIFVDDFSMPEVETFGAQPPVELIRQHVDNGGWYDLKEMTFQKNVDTVVLACMGIHGSITPRMMRHFNLMCFPEFHNSVLERVFSTITEWYFGSHGYLPEVTKLAHPIVHATLEIYRGAMSSLLPTPRKSHYTFNLRDFSRVIQGCLMNTTPNDFDKTDLVRLWLHEATRVFSDRLIDIKDNEWFLEHVKSNITKNFNVNFYDTFEHLDVEATKEINVDCVRRLFFGDYMTPTEEEKRPYKEVHDLDALAATMNEYLTDYNNQSRQQMDLVMFTFAIEHVSRASRVLKMPGGNALLVGMGGSGRQSMAKLATFMAGYKIKQIEITKSYGQFEWREDLKEVLRGAGCSQDPLVFLFSDTQIKDEGFVEDINNMLNAGEVPNIFANDEKSAICEGVRPFAREDFGKAAADMNPQDLYAYFITRVKSQMHIVLAFSPIGSAFRDRMRKFPSLVNCCAIDWYLTWPSDALEAVATKFLKDLTLDSEETREGIQRMCKTFHEDTLALSTKFKVNLKRENYVTPTSYLELIIAFKSCLEQERKRVGGARKRYQSGLEKLAQATHAVNTMADEIVAMQPVLKAAQVETADLMKDIEAQLPGVEAKKEQVGKEEAVVQIEADKVGAEKDSVEADLAEAIPALNEAIAALDTIKEADIKQVKGFANPPSTVRLVCEGVCIFMSIKGKKVPDPDDPSKKIIDYWPPSQTMLGDSAFVNSLKTYDKDNIDPKIVTKIKEDYMTQEKFTVADAAKASSACAGMMKWMLAMITYDRVAKVVAPKKKALTIAEAKLAETLAELKIKQDALKKVVDALQALQDKFEAANAKKEKLVEDLKRCEEQLERAKQLIDGLGGEKDRWTIFEENLGQDFDNLTGDVLLSAGVMAYLGPFTVAYRNEQLTEWVAKCKDVGVPCSEKPTLKGTLGDPVQIRQWNIDKLPTDDFSIENGIITSRARRWPLMIDPQAQANQWVRAMEAVNKLAVIKLSQGDFLRTLENSIAFGTPVLLENVGEELDPSLEPLLLKQIFKKGGVNLLNLGGKEVEYADNFRFYITTKLPNPHYLPEVSVKVTLLNFMITAEGLEDQLLGTVVAEERPDLQEQKNKLVLEGAENKRLLKEIEDNILAILSQDGNILEDEGAILALKESKVKSNEVSEAQEIATKTEAEIDEVRMSYRPVAFSTQVLFFCINDLANVEPVYQYSLVWFSQLFIMSISKSEASSDVPTRLKNLDEHFTYSLYNNVCRSLLEKDKLLFAFLLCSRIMGSKGQVDGAEWTFFLTGGVMLDNPHAKPADWVSKKSWDEICILDQMDAFKGLREDFAANISAWKKIYDSPTPHKETIPGKFKGVSHMQLLCLVRMLRPDKIILAVMDFVENEMSDKFIKPPPFDLVASFNDSTCATPLIFVLSAGADPMADIMKAATDVGRKMEYISLGQGQAPHAVRMIKEASEGKEGSWVVLQNCHLMPSFMTELERLVENFIPGITHENFRLWCTTYPSKVFPVTVLQNGVKMTMEPPKGMRANIMGSYKGDPLVDREFFESCTKRERFERLVYALCFFHALIQERRLFGPLGWNVGYMFTTSDLKISVKQLSLFLDENEDVPFKALCYTAGECNYGGRVTDDKDRRTIICILNRCYNNKVVTDSGCALTDSGKYCIPVETDYDSALDFVDKMPVAVEPEVFGFHDNASITKDTNDANILLETVLLTQSSGGGGGGKSEDDIMSDVATDILGKLPGRYDMEEAAIQYPVKFEESMNTVLTMELFKFNRLLNTIEQSLKQIGRAVKGEILMSAELDDVGKALVFAQIPPLWKKASYPSFKPLASYAADLIKRCDFFNDWLKTKPPSVFWVSSFFFTQAFLTGSKQNFARKYTIPIDAVTFDFEWMPKDHYKNAPRDGVFTKGLFLEAAKWDKSAGMLAESDPKVLYTSAPIIFFKPLKKSDLNLYPHYECPLYMTDDRKGVLKTTGHSTNFVCFIRTPTDKPSGMMKVGGSLVNICEHWVLRGVALLTQLRD